MNQHPPGVPTGSRTQRAETQRAETQRTENLRGAPPDRYVNRFAGDILRSHLSSAIDDGPYARRLTSEVTWKRPPSASVRSEVST